MTDPLFDVSLKAGTAGGILLPMLLMPWDDIGKTALLATTGAVVSFFVSLGLKAILKRLRR